MRATGLRGGKPEDPSVPSPPLRRSPSSSIRKGDPLYGWKNRGRAPGDGFCPSSGGLGSGLYSGPRRPRQAPPPRACLGPTCPTLDYQARFTGFLGSCPGNWKPSLYPRGPCVFPWTILLSRSPTPSEAECPGKTWRPGASAGLWLQCHARWTWTGRAGHTPMDGFSPGDSGLRPPGWLRVLRRLKLPHHAPRRPTRTERLQLSKVWAKVGRKGL